MNIHNIIKERFFLSTIALSVLLLNGCSLFDTINNQKDLENYYVLGPSDNSKERIKNPKDFIPYLKRVYFIHFGNTKLEFLFLSKGYLKSFGYREDNRIPRVVFNEIFLNSPEKYYQGRACFALEAFQNAPTKMDGFKDWRLQVIDINQQKYFLDYEHIYYGHGKVDLLGEGQKYKQKSGGVFCTENVSKEISEDFQVLLSKGFRLRFFEDIKEDPEDYITINYKSKNSNLPSLDEDLEEKSEKATEKKPGKSDEEENDAEIEFKINNKKSEEEEKEEKRRKWRRFQ